MCISASRLISPTKALKVVKPEKFEPDTSSISPDELLTIELSAGNTRDILLEQVRKQTQYMTNLEMNTLLLCILGSKLSCAALLQLTPIVCSMFVSKYVAFKAKQ